MTYSNASPLMVHGKNQQGLRWFVLKPLVVAQKAVGAVVLILVAVVLVEVAVAH